MVGVLGEDQLRDFQQWDVAHVVGLLARLADPHVAIVVARDMLGSQSIGVYVGQASKAAKDKHITHILKAFHLEALGDDPLDLLFGEYLFDDLFCLKFDAGEGIAAEPLVGDGEVDDLFETLHVADDGVLLAAALDLQEQLEGADERAVDLAEMDVRLAVFLPDELPEVAAATFIAAHGDVDVIDADQLPALLVVATEEGQQCAMVVFDAVEHVHNEARGEEFAAQFEVAMDGQRAQLEHADVLVQLLRLAIAATGRFGGLIPAVERDAAFDLRFDGNAVYFDPQADGSFAVGKELAALEKKENTERISVHNYTFLGVKTM